MLFKSQVLSQASGSVGGLVYSHNKAGQYTRARTIPVNPNSTRQQAVRTLMASLASNWLNGLTAAQRVGWATFAANVPVINRLGDTIYAPALAQYIRCNVARLQSGSLDQVDDAPTVYDIPGFTAPTITAADGAANQLSVAFTATDDWANEAGGGMLVYCSRQTNPTRNFWAGPYQFAGVIAGATPTPPTSPETFTLPDTIAVGNRLHVRIVTVLADGRVSTSWRGSAIAA